MRQLHLPIFPRNVTYINNHIAVQKKDGRIYYFHGLLPVYFHDEDDVESFRFITSQLVLGGNVKQKEIARAFGVTYISVKRSVKRLRERGIKGFSQKAKVRSAHVMTSEVINKAQKLLYEGCNAAEVARRLGLKSNTVRKTILEGRLHKKKQ